VDQISVLQEDPGRYADDPSLHARHFSHYGTLSIEPVEDQRGRYTLTLRGASGMIELSSVDLRILVPRLPEIAKGNEILTEIALQQDELNRVDVTMPALKGGVVPHIANNSLRAGLWEFYLTRRSSAQGPPEHFYRAWFEFPAAYYEMLFRENTGMDYSSYSWLLGYYEELEGLPVALGYLRKVLSESVIPSDAIEIHTDQPVLHLPEQEGKRKLLITQGFTTYKDFSDPRNQPIRMAAFRAPGVYSSTRTATFDLSFLGRLSQVVWRRVYEPKLDRPYDELELDFSRLPQWRLTWSWPFIRVTRDVRLIVGGLEFARLPVIRSPEPADSELKHVSFGIGTPEVYSTYQGLLRQFDQQPSTYLLLLDRSGKYINNELAGLGGVYLGRREDGRIEIYAVSYEREAIVAHWTLFPKAFRAEVYRHRH
jgi:hypothetical protein